MGWEEAAVDLRGARVQNFKSVHDSGDVTVEPNVTCLVGKNESGKTSLLEALYRLDSVSSAHPQEFDALRDYPRRFYGRDKVKIPSLPVTETVYELSADDLQDLEALFGTGCMDDPVIRARKGYDNTIVLDFRSNPAALLGHVKTDKRLAGIDVGHAETMSALLGIVRAVVDPPPTVAAFLKHHQTSPEDRLWQRIWDLCPPFIYFSQYDTLPGVVSIKRLQTEKEDNLKPGERTALSLLRLAGVDSEEFDESNYEARKAALEAAANTLTDEVFEFWTQNTDLQIELDIEFRQVDPAPAALEPFLQIRIRNNRHRVTLNFSERSAGFIWFFSFLAYFSEYRDDTQRHVLLLDEPGLNLHATAQADLLRYIDERLADDHQVIYTTHSPFMVQPNHLERARLVEDVDKVGTVVRDDALGNRRDSVPTPRRYRHQRHPDPLHRSIHSDSRGKL